MNYDLLPIWIKARKIKQARKLSARGITIRKTFVQKWKEEVERRHKEERDRVMSMLVEIRQQEDHRMYNTPELIKREAEANMKLSEEQGEDNNA